GIATTEAFGALSRLELTAAAACVTYVERAQLGKRPPISPPVRGAAGETLAIDSASRANLELLRTPAGERRGSLFAAIDRTVTAAGSRLLAQRLAAPLTDSAAIARRLDAVAVFVADTAVRDDIRGALRAAPDMSRALARLSVGRGGPRDLAGLRDGLVAAARARRGHGGVAPAVARSRPRIRTRARRAIAADQARRRFRSRGIRTGARRDPQPARCLAPGGGGDAGALRRRDRGQGPENPP